MSNESTTAVSFVETPDTHAPEVAKGERFEFGGNWASLLSVLDDERTTSLTG